MKSRLACRFLGAAVLSAFAQGCLSQRPSAAPAHAISRFRFTVAAPFARVAPQFGPEAERAWGDAQWNPQFIYPQPGRDIAGAVFTVPHGRSNSIWVNTNYDPVGGRMQYVYVIANAMVCVIDVHVTSIDPMHTAVDVIYTRTALSAEHNEVIAHLAQKDDQSGPVWQRYVEHALGMDGRQSP
jgi:hypothetical protein